MWWKAYYASNRPMGDQYHLCHVVHRSSYSVYETLAALSEALWNLTDAEKTEIRRTRFLAIRAQVVKIKIGNPRAYIKANALLPPIVEVKVTAVTSDALKYGKEEFVTRDAYKRRHGRSLEDAGLTAKIEVCQDRHGKLTEGVWQMIGEEGVWFGRRKRSTNVVEDTNFGQVNEQDSEGHVEHLSKQLRKAAAHKEDIQAMG